MKKYIVLFAPIVFLLICLLIVAFCPIFSSAYAQNEVPVLSVTAVTDVSVDENGVVSYQRGNIDLASSAYKKDVEITFDVGEYDYAVEIKVGDGAKIDVTQQTNRSDNAVTYRVQASGVVTVYAYTYLLGTQVGEKSVTIRSDNNAPEPGVLSEMTSWLSVGQEYVIQVDLTRFSDDLSGRGKGYASFNGGAYNEISDLDLESLTYAVTEPTDLALLFFDNAGNWTEVEKSYDKFDSLPPVAPTISITPNSVLTAYAKYFTVEIDYHTDPASGLKEEQTYTVNGKQFVYTGAFTLDVPTNYTVTAYAEDTVGNRSLVTTENVNSSSFDTIGPTVNSFVVEMDLKKTKICTVRVSANDALSGVASVSFRGLDASFFPTSATAYYAEPDCYGKSELILVVTDKAGNETIEHYPINLFGDATYSEKIRFYAEKYASTDFTRYTEKAKQGIDSAYEELNVIVSSDVSTESEFDAAAKRVDDAFLPDRISYVISEQTSYLTGLMEYEVDRSDFADLLIGEEVKLLFAKSSSDDSLVQKAGFSSGFTDGFSLRLYLGEDEVQNELEHGISVSLNLPVGYYDRDFALYSGGEQVEASVVNNKIEFLMKKGSDYVLVVSGSRAKSGKEAEQKYISVFGRKLSYGVFYGTIFGVIGGVAVIVVVIIVIAKVRGRQRLEY